jgi:uncharacterized repeat protein (TIGR01451 family)
MKKILFFVLLCAGIATAQPVIQTPTPMSACEQQWGASYFNLDSKTPEILGALNPSLYTVRYFYSDWGATSNAAGEQIQVSSYPNFQSQTTTLYVRVTEIADPLSFAIAPVALNVIPAPTATHPTDITISESPFDGFATFDLTSRTAAILGAQTDCTVTFYNSDEDAYNNVNPILIPTAYINATTAEQHIAVIVRNNTTGCTASQYFTLHVTSNSMVPVNIPDPVFKAKIIALGFDTNSDGIIQTSEAAAAEGLELDNLGLTDLTGIQAFTNVTYLMCTQNALTTVDVSGMTNLQTFWVDKNNLTSVNVTGCTALYNFNCSDNHITSINVNGLPTLLDLYCKNNNLTSVNLAGLPALNSVQFENNQLTSFTFSTVPNLKYIYVGYNALTAIDVTGIPSLMVLTCQNNQIASLNFSNNPNLWSVNCNSNLLTSLDISNKPLLADAYCNHNMITSLDLTGDDISVLDCSYNQISSLTIPAGNYLYELNFSHNLMTAFDFSPNPSLVKINCSYNNLAAVNLDGLSAVTDFNAASNQFVEIDMNAMHALAHFDLMLNTLLLHINMKNGQTYASFSYIQFPDSGVLQYVCADDMNISVIDYILNNFTNLPPNSVEVNSYCNFTPTNGYNNITGTIRFDANNNGCDISDAAIANLRVDINDGSNTGADFTNSQGNYNFYTSTGNFALTPNIENPGWFTFAPATANIQFTDNGNNVTTQNFCVSANGVHPDAEVVIAPVSRVRPGFDGVYRITYKNKGNQTLSGAVNFEFGFTRVPYVEAIPAPDTASDGLLVFNYSNLLPFETRSIDVRLHGHTPTDTDLPLNNGDTLDFDALISTNLTDENISDNHYVYAHVVQGSYDPNAITCLEGAVVAPAEIGKYLRYNIEFENTGNFDATNIVIRDVIDTNKYDINSLQVIDASHQVNTRITGNLVEFIFEAINLPPFADNIIGNPPIGGHGNVLFKIRSKAALQAGDSVNNTADIYFDYNAPVATNDAVTTFALLSNAVVTKDGSVSVYPNPAENSITIHADSNLKSIELFDIQGRILQTQVENTDTATLDISRRQSGVYFIKVTSETGSAVEKVIKK